MALVNYTLPFGGIGQTNWATISPLQPHHPTAVNNLLYGPAGHQEADETSGVDHSHYYNNNPYAPPQHTAEIRSRTNNNYLPPPPPPRQFDTQNGQQQQKNQPQQSRGEYQPSQLKIPQNTKTYSDGSYTQIPSLSVNAQQQQYFNSYGNQPTRTHGVQPQTVTQQTQAQSSQRGKPLSGENNLNGYQNDAENTNVKSNSDETRTSVFPERPPGFTRVQAGQGSRTQVHAVLDYDDDNDDYYDDNDAGSPAEMPGNNKGTMPTVTPIQGPIFLKNGTVPVVPLFAYPTINNGTFVQIPIWWTALSVALGLDIRGDIIRGVPCVKRNHQLFCPTAGNTYPIERIERFIDDNKALMRRMYGDFEMVAQYGPPLQRTKKRKRNTDGKDVNAPGVPDLIGPIGAGPEPIHEAGPTGDTYFGKWRGKRQNNNNQGGFSRASGSPPTTSSSRPSQVPPPRAQNLPQGGDPDNSGKIDTCESKIEIVTPYWASNSAGKIRAIVNTQHFEQAIHQEVCTKQNTSRCSNDCSCEQKYKWHRLLAYDPDNDCKGIFMDWFLFPSCCVCRCAP